MRTTPVQVEVNGVAATAAQLRQLVHDSYGHFTAMQVRNGRTRGLRAHLARLDAATRELFGAGLDADQIRGHVRHALAGTSDASVRVPHIKHAVGFAAAFITNSPRHRPRRADRRHRYPRLPVAHDDRQRDLLVRRLGPDLIDLVSWVTRHQEPAGQL